MAIRYPIAIEPGDATHAHGVPSTVAEFQRQKQFLGWIWAVVSVDPAALDDTIERVNITLPRRVLKRFDDADRWVNLSPASSCRANSRCSKLETSELLERTRAE